MMYFGEKLPFTLLFKGWKIRNNGDLGMAIFAIFVLASLFEALRALRERLREKSQACKESGLSSDGSSHGSRCTEIDALVRKESSKRRDTNVKLHFAQSFFHMLQLGVGYLVMLAAMTYNTYIFITIIIASGVSFLLFNYFLVRGKMYDFYSQQRDVAV